MRLSSLLIALGFLVHGCIQPPEYPIIPEIELVGLSSLSMVQSSLNTDSTTVVFSFTDGDGDIGSPEVLNIFVTDLRDNFVASRYRIPSIPEAGSNNGISGEITITLYTTCCVYPNGEPPCTPSETFPTDEVTYEIYITDQAGNKSNTIRTPPITLQCK